MIRNIYAVFYTSFEIQTIWQQSAQAVCCHARWFEHTFCGNKSKTERR